jgi:hypothetical protein
MPRTPENRDMHRPEIINTGVQKTNRDANNHTGKKKKQTQKLKKEGKISLYERKEQTGTDQPTRNRPTEIKRLRRTHVVHPHDIRPHDMGLQGRKYYAIGSSTENEKDFGRQYSWNESFFAPVGTGLALCFPHPPGSHPAYRRRAAAGRDDGGCVGS